MISVDEVHSIALTPVLGWVSGDLPFMQKAQNGLGHSSKLGCYRCGLRATLIQGAHKRHPRMLGYDGDFQQPTFVVGHPQEGQEAWEAPQADAV